MRLYRELSPELGLHAGVSTCPLQRRLVSLSLCTSSLLISLSVYRK